jgi:hypothetical protein
MVKAAATRRFDEIAKSGSLKLEGSWEDQAAMTMFARCGHGGARSASEL